jgi:AcrR family transcriptional regulator
MLPLEMEMGLRERKKEQTRQLIAETAWRLFADRGFEQVTVAEVARQAQVAVATVFNYFPTKEDLFFFRLEAFGAHLVDAIGTRTEGEPVLVAFRRYFLESGGLLAQVEAGDPQALERLRTVSRVIAASPALLAREQQAITRTADALAALLAAETAAPAHDLRPQIAANALIGVHRALIDYTRRRVLADEEPAQLAADVRRLGQRAFALLEHGLGDYPARPARSTHAPTATRSSKDTEAIGAQ